MVSICFNMPRLWMLLGGIVVMGVLLSGCAKSPQPPDAEVSQRIAALTDRIARSQQAVEAASAAGASAEELAPARSKIASAQEALDQARQLLAEGKNPEAMALIAQALGELSEAEAIASKARENALARREQEEMRTQAEARIGQLVPCIDTAYQAIDSAEVAGASEQELAAARSALASAGSNLQQARAFLARGEVQQAVNALDAAEADCNTARNLGNEVGVAVASRLEARPDSYTVEPGNTLWGISGSTPIYANPFMWPIIYKANRDQIRDPDLIYPDQVFAVPRNYSAEESATAIRRAETRGTWRVGDGPDYYILEGVRR